MIAFGKGVQPTILHSPGPVGRATLPPTIHTVATVRKQAVQNNQLQKMRERNYFRRRLR